LKYSCTLQILKRRYSSKTVETDVPRLGIGRGPRERSDMLDCTLKT
jgi:hypothetical protein